MAKIPLRVYNREIETLINRGQIDEAIGHCKHILRFFPKHIDTYRLLGKAYLEAQHYAEASDVLQRVLSAVPDDFVCQIGMSIIREDEGNLDAAIWHMERAFEVQPANAAVQGELRRLYGRRDGIEPPKIRLTRGALVRMYARGELYQQAIGEIRAALAEDPKRIDLEIILARMYYMSGMKVEATEVCSRLITKLPFCYEANRILAEILPETSRADDAKIYQQRVDSMDPYAAYISPNTPTLADVPDNVVTVERLEWNAEETLSQKPEWARTAGIEWEEQQETLPEWMKTSPEPLSVDEKAIVDDVLLPEIQPEDAIENIGKGTLPPEHVQTEEIPDWMQAAGWGKSTGPELPPTENVFIEEPSNEEAIASGDIPDWLLTMAPKPSDETVAADDSDQLDILDTILPGNPAADQSTQPAIEEEIPDWLDDLTTDVEKEKSNAASDMPTWLADLGSNVESPGERQADAAIPDWMQSSESETAASIEAQPEPTEEANQIDLEQVSQAPTIEPAPAELLTDNPEETFAWLEALATRQGAAEETLLTKPEDRDETPPDWLQHLEETSNQPVTDVELSAEPAETQEAITEEIPEWLKSLQAEADIQAAESDEEAAAQASEIPIAQSADKLFTQDIELPDLLEEIEAKTGESIQDTVEQIEAIDEGAEPAEQFAKPTIENEVPDWLKELETEEEATTGIAVEEIEAIDQTSESPAVAEAYPTDVVPEWLKELETEEVEPALDGEGSTKTVQALDDSLKEHHEELPAIGISDEQAAPANISDLDSDSAFAWLESLAARQGAEEETLLIKPEERLETPPEWVKAEIDTAKTNFDEKLPEETAETVSPVSSLEEAQAESMPEWMKSIETETDSAVSEENVPDWLKEAAEEETSKEQKSPELPDWLRAEEIQEQPAAEEPVSTGETPIAGDDAFAWLEALAAKQGADEETLLLKPEDRIEQAPEWIAEQISDAAVMPESSLEVPGSPAESLEHEIQAEPVNAPDWLAELENEPDLHESKENVKPAESDFEPAIAHEEPITQSETEVLDVPDWLKEIEGESEEKTSAVFEPSTATAADEWLHELPSSPEAIPQPEPESSQEEDTQPVPVASPEFSQAEAAPKVEADVTPVLNRARTALNRGKVQEALVDYQELIRGENALEDIIQDLKNALYQYPVNIDLWQTLGDAFARSRRLQDALDSYTKAEELLR